MPDSPITAVLRALDALDVAACVALFAPDGKLLTTDGRTATGVEQVGAVLSDFMSALRGTTHAVSSEWAVEDGVFVAEMVAHYELRDFGRHGPYPRAIVLRHGPGGITDLRFYGSHELPLATSTHPYQDVYAAGHWMPTL